MVRVILAILMGFLAIFMPLAPDGAAQAAAQAGGAPLVFLKDGDLWKWDGSTVTQLTTWGYNERPVLSPNGQRVAYNSWATITIEAIAAGKPVMGLIPSTIWVMEPATGNAVRVADQPPDAVFWQEGTPDRVIMRGTPVWSPDGNRLAWSELVLPDSHYQLVVYDFASGQQTAIVTNLPFPFADAGFIPVHEVLWGDRGILVRNVAVSETTSEFEEHAYLYAPDGTLIHDTLIGSSATEWVSRADWVMNVGQQYLGLIYASGRRYLVDPATGDQYEMPAEPELYSTVTPNNSATAFVGTSTAADGNIVNTWTAVYPSRQQEQMLNFTGESRNIAISSDGQSLAYISDAVYVWQNGTATRVPGTEGIASPWNVSLVWGPNAWRVRTDFPSGGGSPAPIACTLAPRLTIGGSGQVTPGLPNALRTQPRRGPDSLIMGTIPGGGVFTVVSGPQCDNEGRNWWQVSYNSQIGWTPEGEGGIYWLMPYSTTPVPIACTLQPRLAAGTTAYVTPGLPNLIRSLPRRGPDSLIFGRIPGTGVFSVLSGPQCDNEGRYWWQVNYAGITGWTPEGENGIYWLAPFGCPLSPAPRLAPGMQAQVTPGLPNRLRVGPGTNYETITQIPAGGVFTVLTGPQCGPEGWSYWRVQYGTTIGWTAEGEGSTYWIQPLGGTPPPPVPTPTPFPVSCTLPPRMIVGVAGSVLPGLPNILRSAPGTGTTSAILGEIPGGAFFTVLAGPQCGNDGRYWWQVNYNGNIGWTPEGEGNSYWIQPHPGDGPPPPMSCSPNPRLTVAASAFVIPGPANVIRGNVPGSGGDGVIGEIPGGAFFYVLGGPQCGTDGRYWWQINYNGLTGWTGEGEGLNYWVEPFVCTNSGPARLVPGGVGRVLPGLPNALRSAPGTVSGSVIGEIPGGATFTVVGGPQCGNDNRIWWQVNYAGTVGWTAEGERGAYWVEPVIQ